MNRIKYKLPKGVKLEILDYDAERKDRQDSAFYTWWETNDVAKLTFEDREFTIVCVGEMRIRYNDQIIRYCDDLINAGIKNDKDLEKIESSGGEWINNSWFEVYDTNNGEYTQEVYHTVQEAIEGVANWITDKELV